MTRHAIPLAALLLLLAGWQSDTTTRLGFTHASTLWVTGTSTIHDWRCDAGQVDGWIEATTGETVTGIAGAVVTVQAEALECKNGTMDKKTRKALDAEAHPTIRFELTSADVTAAADGFLAAATGQLTIAGQTRTIETEAQGRVTADGQVRLTGEVPVTMSDYGIKPPRAMLGTLKTGDDVVVHFDVVAAPVSDL